MAPGDKFVEHQIERFETRIEPRVTRTLHQTITFIGTEAEPAWQVVTEVREGDRLDVRMSSFTSSGVGQLRQEHWDQIMGEMDVIRHGEPASVQVVVGVLGVLAVITLACIGAVFSLP